MGNFLRRILSEPLTLCASNPVCLWEKQCVLCMHAQQDLILGFFKITPFIMGPKTKMTYAKQSRVKKVNTDKNYSPEVSPLSQEIGHKDSATVSSASKERDGDHLINEPGVVFSVPIESESLALQSNLGQGKGSCYFILSTCIDCTGFQCECWDATNVLDFILHVFS